MPELPEVETIKRGLESVIVGKTITDIEVLDSYMLNVPVEEFRNKLVGKRIEKVRRRGKYLIWELDDGSELVVHLRMTGQLRLDEGDYLRLIFHLNGTKLYFCDLRRMGEMWVVPKGRYEGIEGLATMGPEPLGEGFTLAYLMDVLKKKGGKIKAVLMDQSVVAGIGNIYASEILFEAGVHPERPAKSLTEKEIEDIYKAIKKVLNEALEAGGETFSNYVNIYGEVGNYQPRVYKREGEKCPRCGEIIINTTIGGRSSYFCPNCQR
ncbi:DNA-formamidopyrimidine glycosylase [bacterium]|nr:DNA-formamidopyrimidine glycosylase [bacterium]